MSTKKTLTKIDIIEKLYERLGFSKKEAQDLVESVFEELKKSIIDGQKVKISGFGNFVVSQKKPRKGRNPQTGEQIVISGRRVLGFKPSQVLKERINGDGSSAE